jgi:iron complex outermembrane receptor protein
MGLHPAAFDGARATHAVLTSLLAAFAALGGAQTGLPDLTSISLEDLMQIEVTSVSKKDQKLARVAAAVYVLTQEEIRRAGHNSLPEALRMVPGLQVARTDSNKWAISARGFNGVFAANLLVLIDGRSVYTPLFSGVYWDLQDVALEDVERIEVIRGPGAAVWGANAVTGVISIITKHAKDTTGSLVALGGGNEELGSGYLRHGARLGQRAHYRVYGRFFQRNDLEDESGRPAGDDWNVLRGGFRLDWELSSRDALSLHGDLYGGHSGQRLSTYLLRPPYTQISHDRRQSTGGYFLSRWTRTYSQRSDLAMQLYYDRYERQDLLLPEVRDTLDLDFQHRYALSARHEWMWGLGHRTSWDHVQATPYATLQPDHLHFHLSSAFAQDEILLVPDRLRLTLGAKIEHNSFTGFELQPTARLLWTPDTRHSAWASVSRAVRTPSRGERSALFPQAAQPGPGGLPILITVVGNSELRSETLLGYEAGYRHQPTERVSVDVAAFYNVHRRLRASETGLPYLDPAGEPRLILPVSITNGVRGDSHGLEVAAYWTVVPRWKLAGSYTGLRMRVRPSAVSEGRNPHHQFQVRCYLDLPYTFQFDTGVYYVGTLSAPRIPSYTRVDLRLGWRPKDLIEFSLGIQNLLDRRHLEFIPEASTLPSAVRRSAYGRIAWRF